MFVTIKDECGGLPDTRCDEAKGNCKLCFNSDCPSSILNKNIIPPED